VIAKCTLILAGFAALTLGSCVVSGSGNYSDITGSDEEFRIKYRGLDPIYYDDVVEVETLAARGKNLYDRYYKTKSKKNRMDAETRRQANRIFERALMKIASVHRKSKNDSVLVLQQRISTWHKDLLREVEKPGAAPGVSIPK
jgi:hypothetical protein